MFRLLSMICLVFCAASAAPNKTPPTAQSAVESVLAEKKYPAKSVGIMAIDLDTKARLVTVCADSPFNPASVSKLFTAAAAFEKLGSQYVFTTRIFADSMANGTVRNLYIEGNGDPGFTAERLWLFVEHLYHAGVRRVDADIILDDYFFDSVTAGPGFDEDSGSRAYQPLISALAVNFNCVAVHCRPGENAGDPVYVDLFPEIAGVKIQTTATTAAKGKKSTISCATVPINGGTGVSVDGTMGIDEPGSYTFRKLWQSWESFGGALRPLFVRRGIAFKGRVLHARVPGRIAAKKPLYEFTSEPLVKPVNDMFKYSSNFAAEMVFKTLSARRDTAPGSWERSAAIMTSWWQTQGLPGVPVLKNGSGMGSGNRASAAQITALLSQISNQKTWYPEYLSALSTAGVDGTLKSRFQKSKLKGLVRGKTGTLNSLGVSSLAGYLLLPGRGRVAFAILCNKTGHTQYEDWTVQEMILEKIAEGMGK